MANFASIKVGDKFAFTNIAPARRPLQVNVKVAPARYRAEDGREYDLRGMPADTGAWPLEQVRMRGAKVQP